MKDSKGEYLPHSYEVKELIEWKFKFHPVNINVDKLLSFFPHSSKDDQGLPQRVGFLSENGTEILCTKISKGCSDCWLSLRFCYFDPDKEMELFISWLRRKGGL
jgi:hypothetical protein